MHQNRRPVMGRQFFRGEHHACLTVPAQHYDPEEKDVEGVQWYAYQDGGFAYIIAEFDLRIRRVSLSAQELQHARYPDTLVRHAIEQMTISIKEARAIRAARAAYADLH